METKNGEVWLSAYVWLHNWAIPLNIDVEWYHKDYTEINLSILCFHFSYIRASHKYLAGINDLVKGAE